MTSIVANAFNRFEDMIQTQTDPRVEKWVLMKPYPLFAIVSVYLYVVLVAGPRYMKGKTPYNINRIIQLYNIGQIISCIYLAYLITNSFLFDSIKIGCDGFGVSYDPQQMKIVSIMWWTLLLKLAELVETVFFILRKKYSQVTFLHLYHHVSTLIFMWIGTKTSPGGTMAFPVMLNCVVHTFMYTYYLLTSLGPQWQNRIGKYKRYLTVFQMVQFTIILIHISYVLNSSCRVPSLLVYAFLPNLILVFYLFYDFYRDVYIAKSQLNTH
ncbi:very long chain fatty acid elongase 7-like [Periplaneta americana]|uniref:very long chain fatty acid elongase 7-like n=1 Tax=Periplaneta americana TaxID=6978 RepID=UPI0037E8CE1B